MKLPSMCLLSFACIATTCFSAPIPTGRDYKSIEEHIVFTVLQAPKGVSHQAPAPASFTMGHKDGSKMRDFYLPKDSAYAEMRNLTRQHIAGDGLVGGYFVDELIDKDGKYVVILSGQVHVTESTHHKIYSKQGTWMDSLGRTGVWVDEVQQKSPAVALAACGGK